MAKMLPIDSLLEVGRKGKDGIVRPVESGEEPDFVQKRYKLCTGMMCRLDNGDMYAFDCCPPVQLIPGRGYKIVERVDQ